VSVHAEPGHDRLTVPEPEFEIIQAAHVAFAAAPTMLFSARATEPSGLMIQSIALTAQVMIDPAQRGYDPETRARLAELFGPPAAWAPSTSGLAWARVTTAVPGFQGSTVFGLEVPCTYDLEVAAAKYFYAVRAGNVPLSFHFTGNVFYSRAPAGAGDRPGPIQVAPIAWSTSTRFQMPIDAWRAMIAEHYPGGGWIRVGHATLEALNDRRAARGLPDFDACVTELLEGADGRQA
jgi:hypothetical protein